MTKPTISGINIETGEIVERELNDDELAQMEQDKANAKTPSPD